tara:strand:+ start:1654 stop:2139 length:486 start_codon:yes stop_codon:yes gene_type:complete
MNNIKIILGVLLVLSASRFIPHPPNFTSLIALSFYVPALFGLRYIPVVVLTFLITDLFIGFHSTILFTWGSVMLIGLISKFLRKTVLLRLFGSLLGAIIFFIVTNFGVWASGSYGYNLEGFIQCYLLAIPFFTHTIISTVIFSGVIECLQYVYFLRLKTNN